MAVAMMGSKRFMTAPDTSADQDVTSGGTVIHRKAQAGRAEHQARAMSLGKALRLSLARCADDLFDLALAVIGVRFETYDNDDLEGKLNAEGLLMLLDGPRRARAAAVFDTSLVGALIQQQTMGKVVKLAEQENRPLTPTDAAVCAPFLDDVLARVAGMPEDEDEKRLIAGYAFGAWVEDRRMLSMALEAHEYRLIHIDLDIAGGLRQGKMMLCLPIAEAEVILPDPSPGDDKVAARPPPSDALADTIQNLNAVLRISLSRIKMPLSGLGGLGVGSVLDIGTPNFDTVRVETIAGQTVSRGALGLVEGMRAVRLHSGAKASGGGSRQARGAAAESEDVQKVAFDEAALPDLSDIDGSEEDVVLPDLPDVPALDELPELPDMSDLPDFEDDAELAQFGAG